jgi:hypothetical protein
MALARRLDLNDRCEPAVGRAVPVGDDVVCRTPREALLDRSGRWRAVGPPRYTPGVALDPEGVAGVGPLFLQHRQDKWRSPASGDDADAVAAVDLDHPVGADEVEVLAVRGLPPLGTPNAEDLDVATVHRNVIAWLHTTAESDLGRPSSSPALCHFRSLLPCIGVIQSPGDSSTNGRVLEDGRWSGQAPPKLGAQV